jgi:hypothetical protein
MRRIMCLGVVLLAGCQGVVGPREHRDTPIQVDNPCLTIPEQQRLGRDRLAIPEMNTNIAPRTYVDFLGPNGR